MKERMQKEKKLREEAKKGKKEQRKMLVKSTVLIKAVQRLEEDTQKSNKVLEI